MHYCDARKLGLTEEHDLLVAAQAGDTWARDELIINNVPFIVKRAAILSTGYSWLTADDLVGAGILGLYRAIPKYDIDTTVPFITFAKWDILSQMQFEITYGQLYRLPRWTLWPDVRDNVSEQTKRAIARFHKLQELDAIEDPHYVGTRTDILRHKSQQTTQLVREAVNELPEQQRIVVQKVLAGYLHREIATQLGLKKSTVAQIYKRAKERLRVDLDETQ